MPRVLDLCNLPAPDFSDQRLETITGGSREAFTRATTPAADFLAAVSLPSDFLFLMRSRARECCVFGEMPERDWGRLGSRTRTTWIGAVEGPDVSHLTKPASAGDDRKEVFGVLDLCNLPAADLSWSTV